MKFLKEKNSKSKSFKLTITGLSLITTSSILAIAISCSHNKENEKNKTKNSLDAISSNDIQKAISELFADHLMKTPEGAKAAMNIKSVDVKGAIVTFELDKIGANGEIFYTVIKMEMGIDTNKIERMISDGSLNGKVSGFKTQNYLKKRQELIDHISEYLNVHETAINKITKEEKTSIQKWISSYINKNHFYIDDFAEDNKTKQVILKEIFDDPKKKMKLDHEIIAHFFKEYNSVESPPESTTDGTIKIEGFIYKKSNFNDFIDALINNSFADALILDSYIAFKGAIINDMEDDFFEIKDNVSSNLFHEQNKLTGIKLPKVITIQDNAFESATELTSLVLPEVKTIGAGAFKASKFTTLSLPEAKTIGENAFWTSKLTTLSLPKVTTIGKSAFTDAELTKIYLPSLTSVGDNVFAHVKNSLGVKVTIPAAMNTKAIKDILFKNGWSEINFTIV